MKFFVKFPAGNIMPLEAAESDLIESVKSQIEQQVCIRVHKFALRLGGRLRSIRWVIILSLTE